MKRAVRARIKALMAEWQTLRFALSEHDAAEAWAESMAVHEDQCPSLKAETPEPTALDERLVPLVLEWAAAEARRRAPGGGDPAYVQAASAAADALLAYALGLPAARLSSSKDRTP
jgi:hypothetical protein